MDGHPPERTPSFCGLKIAFHSAEAGVQDDRDPLWTIAVGFSVTLVLFPWEQLRSWWVVAAVVVGGVASWRRCWPVMGVMLAFLAVGSLPDGPALEGPFAVQGVVTGSPSGRRVDVALNRVSRVSGPWTPIEGRAQALFPEGAPRPGTRILAFGEFVAVNEPWLPGEPDPLAALARSRVRRRLEVHRWEVVGGEVRSMDPFERSSHPGILRALALGARDDIPEEWSEVFRKTGTSHVLSISGFHVGLAATLLGGVLRMLLRATATARPAGFPEGAAWLVGAVGGISYAVVAGAPASAQRAAWMALFAAIAHATGRPIRPLNVLGGALIAVLALDPGAIGTAGFQLSFGAMLGLIRVTPWLLKWIPPDQPSWLMLPISALATTVGATVGTLPFAAWWFQEFAPGSPLANLVVLPVMSWVTVPAALIAAIAPDPLSGWAIVVADFSLDRIWPVLNFLSFDLWYPAVGPVGAAVGALVLSWPGRWTACLAGAALLWESRVPEVVAPTITFLDVGQGDAALVEMPGGRRVLVDGGPPGEGVVRWLRRRGIRHLDAVVVSHGHPDHTGGIPSVLRGLRVEGLWGPVAPGLDSLCVEAARNGVPCHLGLADAWHPASDFPSVDLNERSLVFEYPTGVLFSGDVEHEAENVLALRTAAIEILKVPHHGSRTSSSEDFLRAVRPRVAVMSAGRNNAFGHPHPEVVTRYQELGIEVLRTDRDGTVEISLFPDQIRVRTQRAGRPPIEKLISRRETWPWRPRGTPPAPPPPPATIRPEMWKEGDPRPIP